MLTQETLFQRGFYYKPILRGPIMIFVVGFVIGMTAGAVVDVIENQLVVFGICHLC